jgi:hypothetical protein
VAVAMPSEPRSRWQECKASAAKPLSRRSLRTTLGGAEGEESLRPRRSSRRRTFGEDGKLCQVAIVVTSGVDVVSRQRVILRSPLRTRGSSFNFSLCPLQLRNFGDDILTSKIEGLLA